MRWLLILACAFAAISIAATTATASSSSVNTVTLENDRTIRLRILADLSSRTARSGQRFPLAVVDDVSVGSTLVVPRETRGFGVVVTARAARPFWRRGKLRIAINQLVAPDGTIIPVTLPAGIAGVRHAMRGRHGPFGFYGDDVFVDCGTIATVLVAADTSVRPIIAESGRAPAPTVGCANDAPRTGLP